MILFQNTVPLRQVTRIQKGQDTLCFEKHKSWFGSTNTLSFSLIYGSGGERTFDVCAQSREVFHLWFNGLSALIKSFRDDLEHLDVDRRYLKHNWDEINVDNNDSLTKKEIVNLVYNLNIHKPTRIIYHFIGLVDTDNTGLLNFENFCIFMDKLRQRWE